jgi:hypothetical protein
MRKTIAIAAAAAVLFALAGCGDSGDDTPTACLEGVKVYLRALQDAPRAVKLRGQTPISDCLVENQGGGQLATVGSAMVTAAIKLNTEARADPGGKANLQLGYLVGAAQLGSERTDGIHSELLRRLSAAVRYSPDSQALQLAFLRTMIRGVNAGKTRG